MPENLFDIVFRGDLMPGHQLSDVKMRLAQLFKIDIARVEPLFSGAAVALKRNVDEATAHKYQTVLRKAGANVELRRVQEQQGSAAARPATRGLSLAPVGADLLSRKERVTVQSPELDLSHYSIRPLEGYLLDEAERPRSVDLPDPGYDFDLAPVGADLLEAREETEAAPITADFDLAEPGADLLKPEEKTRPEAVQVSTDHITLA